MRWQDVTSTVLHPNSPDLDRRTRSGISGGDNPIRAGLIRIPVDIEAGLSRTASVAPACRDHAPQQRPRISPGGKRKGKSADLSHGIDRSLL